ncbi:uncharacterized protein LOC121638451 [Melanotaenia boesemani]|uniref:uncharacterized protein LOC121638451 n=1 Tax=Melanotaenia boesemani TaxID=1250792 RepID=UPI001C05E5CB|nr:uncharacterized protein LOC121638451 [Melanotaenia boesemani]
MFSGRCIIFPPCPQKTLRFGISIEHFLEVGEGPSSSSDSPVQVAHIYIYIYIYILYQMYSESDMLTGVRMRVVVLFVLGVLGCSLAGARIVSKCELRNELLLAMENLTDTVKQSGLAGENLVAKIVCYAGVASDFNTSAVNELSQKMGGRHSHGKRNAASGGFFGLAEEEGQLTTVQPPVRGRRHSNLQQSSEEEEEVWTQYGLFQLCNGLICSDGITKSPNICGIDCLNLTDDNITDDINCVLKLFTDLVKNGFRSANWKELSKVFKLIFQEHCKDIQASKYFAEC